MKTLPGCQRSPLYWSQVFGLDSSSTAKKRKRKSGVTIKIHVSIVPKVSNKSDCFHNIVSSEQSNKENDSIKMKRDTQIHCGETRVRQMN